MSQIPPAASAPWQLGLTGGIGSGKSTFSQLLVQRGAVLVDADGLARLCTAPGGAAIDVIAQTFGTDMLAPDGGLNRERMRALAFTDATARRRLEAIVHPLVRAQAARQVSDARAQGRQWVVHDIPLLAESGRSPDAFDAVLVVDCTEATQIARVVARDGLPIETVQTIIAAQASRAKRLAIADIVVFNDGTSPAALSTHADAVARIAEASRAVAR